MRVTELCPSPHLEAADLGDEIGDSRIVTIKGVDIHVVGAEQVRKGVVYFEEFDRGLVINKTNSSTIAGLYGNETDEWTGHKITLYRSETSFKNKTVPCIRVKDSVPKEPAAETPARNGKK